MILYFNHRVCSLLIDKLHKFDSSISKSRYWNLLREGALRVWELDDGLNIKWDVLQESLYPRIKKDKDFTSFNDWYGIYWCLSTKEFKNKGMMQFKYGKLKRAWL